MKKHKEVRSYIERERSKYNLEEEKKIEKTASENRTMIEEEKKKEVRRINKVK